MEKAISRINEIGNENSNVRERDIRISKETIEKLFNHAGEDWIEPTVSYNADENEIELEWWARTKSLMLWFGEETYPFGYLIAKGPRMFTDMDDGVVDDDNHLFELYDWLTKEKVVL